MTRKSLVLWTLFFVFQLNFHCLEATDLKFDHVWTVEQWEKIVTEDSFYKSFNRNTPLTDQEKRMINYALQYANQSHGGILNRDIKEFKGSHLLIGTGWAHTQEGTIVSQAMKSSYSLSKAEEKALSTIKNLSDMIYQFSDNPEHEESMNAARKTRSGKIQELSPNQKIVYGQTLSKDIPYIKSWNKNVYTGKPMTVEARDKIIQDKEDQLEEVKKTLNSDQIQALNENRLEEYKEKYYTVDISEKALPDMVGSATSLVDMSKLPDQRFDEVYFENVDCNVFLDPASWNIIERITKPNGKIIIPIASSCARLIPFIVQKTKWAKDVHSEDLMNKESYTLELINH